MAQLADMESKRRFLAAHGAGPELAMAWSRHVRPFLSIEIEDASVADRTAPGMTKLGGLPDGPEGAAWPVRPAYDYAAGREPAPGAWSAPAPLAFLAQINLADVAALGGVELALPESGLLQVYYDMVEQPWGFDPADRAGFRVLYVPPGLRLARRTPPPFEHALHGPVATVRLTRDLCLPDTEWVQDRLLETGMEIEQIWSAFDAVDEDVRYAMTPEGHAFGGWPSLIQGTIEDQCEYVCNGLYCGDGEAYQSEEAARLRPLAAHWRQLVQLDFDEDLEWTWGDAGRLYAMARTQDIAVTAFDRAHVVFQCS